MSKDRRETIVYLAANLALAAFCYLALGLVFRSEVPLTFDRMALILAAYAFLYLLFRAFGGDIYNYFPPRILHSSSRGEEKNVQRLRVKLFLFNSHFLLLISMCNLWNFNSSTKNAIMDTYPILKGNIVIFFKQQSSGFAQDRELYRLGLHTMEIVKRSVRDIADAKSNARMNKRTGEYLKLLRQTVKGFDFKRFYQTINDRILYNGKEPIYLMNIDLYNYSAHPVSAFEIRQFKRTNAIFRHDPIVPSGAPIELVKGVQDDGDKSMLQVPRYPPGGAFYPDSLNFLKFFNSNQRWLQRYYSDRKDKGARMALINPFVPPESPPVLIWLNNDCNEPDERLNFTWDNGKWNNDRLRQAFFKSFFRKKIFIYVRGFDGRNTAMQNLKVERYFDADDIIMMPRVNLSSSKDTIRAINHLHENLPPKLQGAMTRGIKTEFLEKPLRKISETYILFTILLPFFLWITLMTVRHAHYMRED